MIVVIRHVSLSYRVMDYHSFSLAIAMLVLLAIPALGQNSSPIGTANGIRVEAVEIGRDSNKRSLAGLGTLKV